MSHYLEPDYSIPITYRARWPGEGYTEWFDRQVQLTAAWQTLRGRIRVMYAAVGRQLLPIFAKAAEDLARFFRDHPMPKL